MARLPSAASISTITYFLGSNMPSPKTDELEALQSYAKYAWNSLDMASQLHAKQKTFLMILKIIRIRGKNLL
jgi:hypothetical protein